MNTGKEIECKLCGILHDADNEWCSLKREKVVGDGLLAEEKLKPCPFCEPSEAKQCGNEPVLSHLGGFIDEDGRKCTNGLAVICPHCLAQGPKMGEKGDAVETWNERSILS